MADIKTITDEPTTKKRRSETEKKLFTENGFQSVIFSVFFPLLSYVVFISLFTNHTHAPLKCSVYVGTYKSASFRIYTRERERERERVCLDQPTVNE